MEKNYRAWAVATHTLAASWRVQEREYAGELSVGPASSAGDRRLSLTYTAPAALAGVTLTKEGEKVTVSLEGLSFFGGEEYAGAFCIFRFFFCDGQGYTASPDAEGGHILSFSDGEGEYTARFPAGSTCPDRLTYIAPDLTLSLTLQGGAAL